MKRGGGKLQLLSSSTAGLTWGLHHTGHLLPGAIGLHSCGQRQSIRGTDAEIPTVIWDATEPTLSILSLGLLCSSFLVCAEDKRLGESKPNPYICLDNSWRKTKQNKTENEFL